MPQFIAVGRVVDELARRGGPLGEKVDAPLVELVKELVQPLPGVGGGEGIAVGFGGERKAIWNQHAFLGQRRVQLPQRSVLAADQRDVAEPNVGKPADIVVRRHGTFLAQHQ